MYFPWMLVLFVGLPMFELWMLMLLSSRVGLGMTFLLVIMTGVIGASMAKLQGFRVVTDIQRDMAEGRMPAPRMMDGVMILIAGALLVTPGLITDTVGFLLLVPAVRIIIRNYMRIKLEQKLREGTVTFTYHER